MKLFVKILKWIFVVLVICFVGIQFIPVSSSKPAYDPSKTIQATMNVPPEVTAIFERACNDCHSSQTTWPWYNNVAPVSWWLADHVNDARRHLSFSEWGTYKPRRVEVKLKEICDEVTSGEMPLGSYLIMHPSAKLTEADKQLICNWANQELERVRASQPPDPEE
jgi:hypothetical protein